MLTLRPPYLLFLGHAPDVLAAKTAVACAQWRPDLVVGQVRLSGCRADAGVPDLTVRDAAEAGAATLVIGVVAPGGAIETSWVDCIVEALESGLDVVSGMHERLDSIERIRDAARTQDRRLVELRHLRPPLVTGTGRPRSGRRVLTVGTDCSCGKMFTSLMVTDELARRGVSVDFRATGQTGMLIAGAGIAIDAVAADFISGAVEQLCPAADDDHFDVIEGQGSLFHPAFAGVTLGLLHGAQPDAMILCDQPLRPHMRGLPDQPLPSIEACLRQYLDSARLVSPRAEWTGISLNTQAMSTQDAEHACAELTERTGLPCLDPRRHGVSPLVDALLS